jgi:hypothetical protein
MCNVCLKLTNLVDTCEAKLNFIEEFNVEFEDEVDKISNDKNSNDRKKIPIFRFVNCDMMCLESKCMLKNANTFYFSVYINYIEDGLRINKFC